MKIMENTEEMDMLQVSKWNSCLF